jgi:DNA-binding transcriptional regulator YiaG
MWRRPGRRNKEREAFARLMREVERVRLRDGLSKAAVARELGTSKDVLYDWVSGKTIGRKESVERLREFVKSREISGEPRTFRE